MYLALPLLLLSHAPGPTFETPQPFPPLHSSCFRLRRVSSGYRKEAWPRRCLVDDADGWLTGDHLYAESSCGISSPASVGSFTLPSHLALQLMNKPASPTHSFTSKGGGDSVAKLCELQSCEIQTLKKLLNESRNTFFSQLQACAEQKDATIDSLTDSVEDLQSQVWARPAVWVRQVGQNRRELGLTELDRGRAVLKSSFFPFC